MSVDPQKVATGVEAAIPLLERFVQWVRKRVKARRAQKSKE